ncbi:MAG TPA: TlpA disulfide reductase family protein [Polyangiales bacterium]|nr:TlpA disulfide reductase family protein [Polyangiales bacterium]
MILVALGLSACAGSTLGTQTPQLDLKLEDEQGRTLQLSALRGRPALLFLFATFDTTSQLALTPLLAAPAELQQRATLIGVAVQPDAKLFLGPFREALDIHFPVYFEPEGKLLEGKTELGELPGVPAYVALDKEGHIRGTFFGVAKTQELEALVDSAE